MGADLEPKMDDDKVVVVGAVDAWPFYQRTGAYICQANRYFQPDIGRIGFYSGRLIHGLAPRIVASLTAVEMSEAVAAALALSPDPLARRFGEAIDASLDAGTTDPELDIYILTPADDPDTAKFQAVKHEGKSAWTQRQRYVSLNKLLTATTTEDLYDVEVEDA